MDTSFCCRCLEDFPIDPEPTTWSMGKMRKLLSAPMWMQRFLWRHLQSDAHETYLCGNCYFDLMDEKEEMES